MQASRAGLGWAGRETGGRDGHGRVFAASDTLDLIERMIRKEIIRKMLLELETAIKPN